MKKDIKGGGGNSGIKYSQYTVKKNIVKQSENFHHFHQLSNNSQRQLVKISGSN